MTDLLNIWIGDQIVARGTVQAVKNSRGETTYSLQIKETIRMPDQPTTRRERRRMRPGLLEKLLDPQRERPFLKMLWEKFGPMLLDFLTTKLPIMLAAQRPDKDDDTDVA